MTTFYICRHGKTEYNLQKRLQGHIDTPLTEEGIQNAHDVASKLKDTNLDLIISSDLGRAFITAYIISRDLNYSKEIIRTNALREANFGTLAGMKIADADAKYPQVQNDIKIAPPEGESLEHMQERAFAFVSNFANENKNMSVLLVTHDGVINAIYTEFMKIDFAAYNKDHYNTHDFVGKFVFSDNKITSFESIL